MYVSDVVAVALVIGWLYRRHLLRRSDEGPVVARRAETPSVDVVTAFRGRA
jgi:hypothetical protein